MTAKPPYRIPTVRAALRRKRNGYAAIGTFSGAGGSSLGLTMAGWTVKAAAEFLEEAVDTYRANFPATPIETRDIRAVSGADLLELAGIDGELDLFEGSPPCDPFSTAGDREKKWGKEKTYMGGRKRQQTDDLFFEWIRLVGEIRPRACVAENVSGLAIGKARGYLREIVAALKGHGYRVEARMLDAKWLGVPQNRRRLFVQGIREDLDADPAWPDPLPYFYTIADALPWIAEAHLQHGAGSYPTKRGRIVTTGEPSPTVQGMGIYDGKPDQVAVVSTPYEHERPRGDCACRACRTAIPPAILGDRPQFTNTASHGFVRAERDLDEPAPTITASQANETLHAAGVPPGYDDLPDEERGATLDTGLVAGSGTPSWGRKRGMRRSSDDASPTVIAEADSWSAEPGAGLPPGYADLPPEERGTAPTDRRPGRRKLTIGEVRRLCGFPDDYRLTGNYTQRWARLGMAVPPPMLEHLGRAIARRLAEVDARE